MHCEQNIGTFERWGRVVAGGLAVSVGLALLLGVASFIAEAVAVVLVLLGSDSILTGLTGYCPIYGLLDKSSAHPHRSSAST
jgi:hypothetical protein